jgi:hypothetical protein
MPIANTEKENQISSKSRISNRSGKHTVIRYNGLGVFKKSIETARVPHHGRVQHRGRIGKSLDGSGFATEKSGKGWADLEGITPWVVAGPAGRGRAKSAIEALCIGLPQLRPSVRVWVACNQKKAGQEPDPYNLPREGSRPNESLAWIEGDRHGFVASPFFEPEVRPCQGSRTRPRSLTMGQKIPKGPRPEYFASESPKSIDEIVVWSQSEHRRFQPCP